MISEEHHRDERDDGEKTDQRGSFAGDRGQLDPEGAGAPGVEREPSLDTVGEVAALPQLGAEIVDFGSGHGPEYSTGSSVVSPDLSMNSDQSVAASPLPVAGGSGKPATASRKRSRLTKFFSAALF